MKIADIATVKVLVGHPDQCAHFGEKTLQASARHRCFLIFLISGRAFNRLQAVPRESSGAFGSVVQSVCDFPVLPGEVAVSVEMVERLRKRGVERTLDG